MSNATRVWIGALLVLAVAPLAWAEKGLGGFLRLRCPRLLLCLARSPRLIWCSRK